jgi:hypothetical protein
MPVAPPTAKELGSALNRYPTAVQRGLELYEDHELERLAAEVAAEAPGGDLAERVLAEIKHRDPRIYCDGYGSLVHPLTPAEARAGESRRLHTACPGCERCEGRA